MRAAAIPPIAIITIGAYLMIATAVAFSPTWIALGVLAIAVTSAVAMVSISSERSSLSR